MSDAPNGDRDKGWGHADAWIVQEADMNKVLAPVTDVLLARAGDVRGKRVLDIGCGTGAVSFALQAAGAKVTASDVSPEFLTYVAGQKASAGVETLLGDAQTTNWPHAYDLVVSRFGVMFFADPKAAFANIAHALRPGGEMILAAWAPYAENPWFHVPGSAAAKVFGISSNAPDPHVSGPFGLSDAAWALEKMQKADLSDLRCETVDLHLGHPDGVEAAALLSTRIGFAARLLREQAADEDNRQTVVDAIANALSPFQTRDGMNIPARLHLFVARRV